MKENISLVLESDSLVFSKELDQLIDGESEQ